MDPRVTAIQEQVNHKRSGLSEQKWADYCENLEGWDRSVMAQLLENEAQHIAALDEDTKTAAIGSFEKFIFPMIRTVWPNLVSTELVSVQPMEGPISMVFYLDFTAGSNKGNTKLGDALITARTGMREEGLFYASETVNLETLTGGLNSITGNLSYHPVRPGSASFTYTIGANTYNGADNGAGSVTGPFITAGTIDYNNGAVNCTVVGNVASVQATYDYNSEGYQDIPQMDASLTSAPVVSRGEKLRTRWSVEVSAQLRAIHGLEAEKELTEALAQQIRFGIDNRIINDLYDVASAGTVVFDVNPPNNVPFFTHQMSLIKTLQSGGNKVFKATRRGFPNWCVCGVDAATIFESHPLFESAGSQAGPGVVFSGVFANRWKIFKNPFLTSTNPNKFGPANFLMGYKGETFTDTGYIYAPWIPFYQTPTIELDDMMFRKAVMTHYGKKVVNSLFYVTGLMQNA